MRSVAPIVVRVLVTLVAIGAGVAQVAYVDAVWWQTLGWTASMSAQMSPALLTLIAAHAVVSIVSALFAVALVLHEGKHQAASRGLGVALGAWSYLMAYSGITLLLRPDPGASRTIFEAHFLVVEVAGLAGLLRFTSLFPRPLAGESFPVAAALPAVLKPVQTASRRMLQPTAPWLAGIVALLLVWGLTAASDRPLGDAALHPVMDLVRFAAAGLVVLNLRRSWRRATPEDAQQMRWLLLALVFILGALLLLVGGNVLMAVTGWREPRVAWRPLLMDLGLVGFLVALAMAVLNDGRFDPHRAARRLAALSTVATVARLFDQLPSPG